MKPFILALLLVMAAGAACSHEAVSGHRLGALGDPQQIIHWRTTTLAVSTTANATTIVFDTTGGDAVRQTWTAAHRFLVSMRCDQDTTLLYQVKRTGSTTWRTFNGFAGTAPSGHCTGFSPGSGQGDTVKASTDTACDYLVLGPDSRIEIVNGATPPTTCEVDIGYFGARDLGM